MGPARPCLQKLRRGRSSPGTRFPHHASPGLLKDAHKTGGESRGARLSHTRTQSLSPRTAGQSHHQPAQHCSSRSVKPPLWQPEYWDSPRVARSLLGNPKINNERETKGETGKEGPKGATGSGWTSVSGVLLPAEKGRLAPRAVVTRPGVGRQSAGRNHSASFPRATSRSRMGPKQPRRKAHSHPKLL